MGCSVICFPTKRNSKSTCWCLASQLLMWDISESQSAPLPSSNLIVPTPALPLLPLIDIATLELPADQQEPTELTLFGLKKSALDPGLVGFQDLEIRHGASEQVGGNNLSPHSCTCNTRWWRTPQGLSQVEDLPRETPWIHLRRSDKQLSAGTTISLTSINPNGSEIPHNHLSPVKLNHDHNHIKS